MSAAVKPSTEGDAPAFAISVALHGALLLLPLLAGMYGHIVPPKPQALPNSIAMVGNSIEVDTPTTDLVAAPAAPETETETEPEPKPEPVRGPVSVKSLPQEPAAALDPAATPTPPPAPGKALAPAKPRPKAAAKPRPAAPASTPSSGSDAPTTGAPAAGTFGAEGLAPGVRRLGYAFTRAIPAATPADSAWRELPAGHVGTIRIELEVDDSNHLGALKHWQQHPGEPAPPAVLERMVERTLLLLRAGQFALSGSNNPGSERLTIDVTLKDDAPDTEGAEVVVHKAFDGATPGHPGKASFRYGTGRTFEAKVTISNP
jgi:hypothetical protein